MSGAIPDQRRCDVCAGHHDALWTSVIGGIFTVAIGSLIVWGVVRWNIVGSILEEMGQEQSGYRYYSRTGPMRRSGTVSAADATLQHQIICGIGLVIVGIVALAPFVTALGCLFRFVGSAWALAGRRRRVRTGK